ncbi:MAG: UDP-glucose 4-epimerase GalE [Candidatus Aminicenantes bacterium]|uniref:UDP-glucose 4-epimerase n=1 Tax=Candidatus Saccharicenans subterraneus TaxID=2508984 RepID=A0A3E2BMA6_9BACT|nr:UDP-glucose 4-epimerase GalE [Candidatus Aminicenantes bacterium]RFT15885.1 MAG: UDP-glucose 4-epimerase [Candidatus Saccharicenans subterraneum]
MAILVTGGAGYIGSHTVKELLKRKYEVIVFDNLSTGHRELVPGGHLVEADLRSLEEVRDVFRRYPVEAVMHFAALMQVGESYADPQKYYVHNLVSSLNLLQAMLEAEVKYFIFSSSAAVYGQPLEIPIREGHPLQPINPYGASKFMVERMLPDYDRAYGLRYVSLRYFNAAGADPEGQLGEWHDPETHLIPNILLHLLGRNPGFQVFGQDFPTADGTAIRDYIHVTDLARAHVLALEKLKAGEPSQVVNLGSSRGYSVLEVIRAAEKVTGKRVSLKFGPRRPGDVPVLLASSEKAETLLGWKREFSDLEFIIETAWKWHLTH